MRAWRGSKYILFYIYQMYIIVYYEFDDDILVLCNILVMPE